MIIQLIITRDEYNDPCHELCYRYEAEHLKHTIISAILKKYFPPDCKQKIERKSKRKFDDGEVVTFTSKSFYKFFLSISEKALEAKNVKNYWKVEG